MHSVGCVGELQKAELTSYSSRCNGEAAFLGDMFIGESSLYGESSFCGGGGLIGGGGGGGLGDKFGGEDEGGMGGSWAAGSIKESR